MSFRSQAIGWLLITERCIKSLAVNNVITAVQGLASPTVTGCHLPLFSLFLCFISLSITHCLSLHNECSSVLHMLCNYSTPVAPGGERTRVHSSKAQAPQCSSTSTLPLASPLSSEGGGTPQEAEGNHGINSRASQKCRISSCTGVKKKARK